MTKRQLKIAIGIIGFLVLVGLFVTSYNTPHYFKIPIFDIIFGSLKITAEIFTTLSKILILGIWHFAIGSWLSALITLGIIVLLVLGILYQRKK